MDGQRPDRRQVPGGADARPGGAAVVAREQPGVPGGQKAAGLAREGNQRLDPAVQRKRGAMTDPRLARVRAMPDSPASRPEVDVVVHAVHQYTKQPVMSNPVRRPSPRTLDAGRSPARFYSPPRTRSVTGKERPM